MSNFIDSNGRIEHVIDRTHEEILQLRAKIGEDFQNSHSGRKSEITSPAVLEAAFCIADGLAEGIVDVQDINKIQDLPEIAGNAEVDFLSSIRSLVLGIAGQRCVTALDLARGCVFGMPMGMPLMLEQWIEGSRGLSPSGGDHLTDLSCEFGLRLNRANQTLKALAGKTEVTQFIANSSLISHDLCSWISQHPDLLRFPDFLQNVKNAIPKMREFVSEQVQGITDDDPTHLEPRRKMGAIGAAYGLVIGQLITLEHLG